jgi:hypothetical protein
MEDDNRPAHLSQLQVYEIKVAAKRRWPRLDLGKTRFLFVKTITGMESDRIPIPRRSTCRQGEFTNA